MWFITAGGLQNLLVTSHGTTTPPPIDFSFPYTIPLKGSIEIEKVNKKFEQVPLDNVGFIVLNREKNKYVNHNSEGKVVWEANKENAEVFWTKDGGKLRIENLKLGRYYFYEVENRNPGYDPEPDKAISCNINKINRDQKTIYKKIKNDPKRVIIQIEKEDMDVPEFKLPNVEFIVEKVGSGFIKSGGHSIDDKPVYGGTREEATQNCTFKTDGNGIAYVYEVDKNSTYYFYEVVNPNDGYEAEPYKAIPMEVGASDEDINRTTYTKIQNKRKYVKLSGMVWDDSGEDKPTLRNNILDGEDKGLPGVIVRVVGVKPTGEKVYNIYNDTVTSDGSDGSAVGTYSFGKIEIALINGEDGRVFNIDGSLLSGTDYTGWHCMIEFEYDGLIYQSVDLVKHELDENGEDHPITAPDYFSLEGSSKACEGSERETFNNKFERVQGLKEDSVEILQTNAENNLEHVGKVNYDISEPQTAKVVSTENLNITSDTDRAGYGISYDRKSLLTELTGFDLGLYKRAQIDLRTAQDLQDAIVSIKGTSHLYRHGGKLTPDASDFSDEGWNIGVKWTTTAKQPIYRADAVYQNDEHPDQNLNVDLIYKIGLKNENKRSDIAASVLELVDYFDARYTIKAIGRTVDNQGNITDPISNYTESALEGSAYKKVDIKLDGNGISLGDQNQFLYIKFALSRENVLAILNGDPEQNSLRSIAEIIAYKTVDTSGKNYAAVDKDAVADNVNLFDEAKDRYEDDTNDASTLELVISDVRSIKGTVFEDDTEKALLDENIRQGNGTLDTGKEPTIAGVRVKLMEKIDGEWVQASRINEETQEEEPYITITEADGSYSFDGFTPGEYKVEFEWGKLDEEHTTPKYTITDYKATIVDKARYDEAQGNDHWYLNANELGDTNINLENDGESRATDNYELRTTIDDEANRYMQGANKKDDGFNHTTGNIAKEINTMVSSTAVMKFDVEYNKNILEAIEYVREENKVKFIVNGMNLGIIRRPIQQIDIDKYVSDVKLSYESQEPIVDAELNQNGEIGGVKPDHIKYEGSSTDRRKAQIEITLDNEIQGNAGIEVGYKYVIINESERDYKDESFQKFGKAVYTNAMEDKIAKLTPSVILDYLGNASSFKVDDLRNKVGDDYVWKITDATTLSNNTVVDGAVLEGVGENQIYQTTVDKQLVPGEVYDNLQMVIEKRFTNGEDILLSNQVEIVNINKPFGSSVVNERLDEVEEERYITGDIETYITPGNYIPATFTPKEVITLPSTELDDAMAERLIVVPSYGTDRNYTPYIVIAITALVGLAGGIYFITKKHKK